MKAPKVFIDFFFNFFIKGGSNLDEMLISVDQRFFGSFRMSSFSTTIVLFHGSPNLAKFSSFSKFVKIDFHKASIRLF